MSIYIKRVSSSVFRPFLFKNGRLAQGVLEFFKFSLLPFKKYLFFLLSLGISLGMLYASKTSWPVLTSVQGFFLEVNSKVRLSYKGLSDRLVDIKEILFHYQETLATKQRLEIENATLRRRLISLAFIQQENEKLREAVALLPGLHKEMLTVHVLESPLRGWNRCFMIGGGATSGIQKGQPVLSEYGVIGQISMVTQHSARVMPLTHPDSRIPVRGLSSKAEAILAGDGSPYPFLIYLQENKPLEGGEIWVTSNYGGRFPPGYIVGHFGPTVDGKRLIHSRIPWNELQFVHVSIQVPSATEPTADLSKVE